VDFVVTPCSEAMWLIGRGAAEQCPNNYCGPRVVTNGTEERFAPLVRDPNSGRLAYVAYQHVNSVWYPDEEIRVEPDGTVTTISLGEGVASEGVTTPFYVPAEAGSNIGFNLIAAGFNQRNSNVDVPKNFRKSFSCNQSADKVVNTIRKDFSKFTNFGGRFGPAGVTVNVAAVSFGRTPIEVGNNANQE
jgi:hypothetical protein